MSIATLGGMIGPITADPAMTEETKPPGYSWRTMAGASNEPMAAHSASATPTMSSVISTGAQLAACAIRTSLVEAAQPGDDHDRHQQRADRQGEVEPEDRHAQRQRVLVALGRKDLEPGYGEHDQEQEREQFGDDPEGPLSARPQPAAGARGDVALFAQHEHGGEQRHPDHPVARQL